MSHPSAPVAEGEAGNLQLRTWGKPPSFSFAPRDHVQIGQALDLIDFETGAKVAGQKFYYLKNQAVILELSLVRYAMDALLREGFTPMITPDVAREEIVAGHGFNPRGPESNIYPVEGTDLCLIATAEFTLGGYNAGRVLPAEQLPIRFAGLSHCFRREAGAAGQFSKGLYRVHQFTKVEMFVFCLPSDSEAMLDRLIGVEEKIFQGLEIPYRIVDTCTGDLGGPPTGSSTSRRGCPVGERRASGGRSPARPTAPTTRPGAWASGSRTRGEEPLRAHAERDGTRGLADPDRAAGELPAGRRQRADPRRPGRLHGIQGDRRCRRTASSA